MGNSSSNNFRPPSAQSVADYRQAMKKYNEDCAAMEAEEAAAKAQTTPNEYSLAMYFFVQTLGLCCELPCRTFWHGSCCTVHGCCCLPTSYVVDIVDRSTCENEFELYPLAQTVTSWHRNQTRQYIHLGRFIGSNLLNPCEPHYIYAPDVSITRPVKPVYPQGSGGGGGQSGGSFSGGLCPLMDCMCECGAAMNHCHRNCSQICSNCNESDIVDRISSLHNRDIRSKLFLFSLWTGTCFESLHLSSCFGPWPCFGETPIERLGRWHQDYELRKEARTTNFWNIRDCHENRYSFCRSESGHIRASIVEDIQEGYSSDDIVPWARGIFGAMLGVSCALTMLGMSSLCLHMVGSGNVMNNCLLNLTAQSCEKKVICSSCIIGGLFGFSGIGGECKGGASFCCGCCLRGGGAPVVEGNHVDVVNPFSVFNDDLDNNRSNQDSFGQAPNSFVIARPQSDQESCEVELIALKGNSNTKKGYGGI